jgi:serine/threonine protein kinase
VDFGLGRLGSEKRMTKTGIMIGTPRYMAPEQIESARSADPRSDVYALGVITHEALCGRSPFDAQDAAQLLGQVIRGRIRRLEEENPSIPARLAEVVRRAMARQRHERFRTVGEFAEAYAETLGLPTGRSSLLEMAPGLFEGSARGDSAAEPLQPERFVAAGPPRFTPPPPAPRRPPITVGEAQKRRRRRKKRRTLHPALIVALVLGVLIFSAGAALGVRGLLRLARQQATVEPTP